MISEKYQRQQLYVVIISNSLGGGCKREDGNQHSEWDTTDFGNSWSEIKQISSLCDKENGKL